MNPETKQLIYNFLDAAGLIGQGKTIDTIKDEDLINALWQHTMTLANTQDTSVAEARKTAFGLFEKLFGAKVAEAKPGEKTDLQRMEEMLHVATKLNSQNYLNTKVSESKLPTPLKDKIHKLYDGTSLTNEQIDSIMVAEQEAFSKLDPQFVNNGGADIKLKNDEFDKMKKAFEFLMIDPITFRTKLSESERAGFKDVAGHYSFLELYRAFTGDNKVTGKIFKGSVAESVISSTFAEIMGVSMHRSMLKEYNTSAFNQDWRKIVSIVPRSDFKLNTVTNMGGYDDLPVVTETSAYLDATTPGEEAVTYALLKRGYVETISMEAIRNDDLGAIRRIPVKWGRASARTLYKYIFNLILNNTAMAYDSKALLHADHVNLISNAALDATSYVAARKLLAQQVEKNSLEYLGFAPKYLLAPIGLEKMAYELTQAAFGKSNQVPEFFQTWQVEPIIVPHQTDNSWRLVVDPSEAILMELGFLDGNESPEMFTQDLPTQGYAFSNDGIKMKVRHIYAGKLTDHRAIAGSIVV